MPSRACVRNDFADILPFTTATRAPWRRAFTIKFGQSSDSTMITSRGFSRLRKRRTTNDKSNGSGSTRCLP